MWGTNNGFALKVSCPILPMKSRFTQITPVRSIHGVLTKNRPTLIKHCRAVSGGWLVGWMDGLIDSCLDEWMDGRKDGWMDTVGT